MKINKSVSKKCCYILNKCKMSCNTCQTNFTFFTREHGCPSCKFSYCSKCLKYKVELPDQGTKKVCGKCYNRSQTRNMSTEETENNTCDETPASIPPVDITNKLELLENPARPPIVMYKQDAVKLEKLKVGMEPADQEIIDRLKKLKGEDHQAPPPTIDEINRRLALLKEKSLESMETSPIDIHAVDTRTDQQKQEDLLKQYMERVKMEQGNSDSVDDIRKRLDYLKGLDPAKVSSQSDFGAGDEDEETVTKKLIQKALEEAAIEAKYGTTLEEAEELGLTDQNDDDDIENAPMCYDCGDTDGLVHCKGCENKLYCSLCFEDNHDEDEVDLRKHIKVPFKESKNSSAV